jgi:hypothetical protein
MLYHPEGFADSSNIIIKNSCAFYYYNGNSYLEKLKNGLSLERVCNEEIIQNVSLFETIKEENISKNSSKNKIYTFYDDMDFFCKLPKERKYTKCNKKQKRKCINKKNRIRQKGFDDKMFCNYQNTIHFKELLNKKDLEELELNDYWEEYYNEHYENYYKGIQEEMRENYEEDNYIYEDDNYKELYRELLCGY